MYIIDPRTGYSIRSKYAWRRHLVNARRAQLGKKPFRLSIQKPIEVSSAPNPYLQAKEGE